MKQEQSIIEKRKTEHLSICLNEDVNFQNITSGFERFRFKHLAMPEIDFAQVSLKSSFLNNDIATPYIVSSMTGGSNRAYEVNKQLAISAEKRGWVLALGSMRAAIEHSHLLETYKMRELAPTIPIIANMGLVQMNYGLDLQRLQNALSQLEVDALVLHLNPMQEIFQPEGDKNFTNLWAGLSKLMATITIPIGIKEVGMGLDAHTISRFIAEGVTFVDVAGAGGTSWIEVEKYRSQDEILSHAATAFQGWGIPTSEAICEAKPLLASHIPLVASGGIQSGVDAAKAIALGATHIGVGRALLEAAMQADSDGLDKKMKQYEFELKAAMFGIGAATLTDLAKTDRLHQLT